MQLNLAGPRPPGALLPPARAGLGGRGVAPEGRPEGDQRAGAEHLPGRTRRPGYFRDIQNRLKKFVESGQLGPFANGYWGNPAYKLPPEANLMAVTHYLEALDFQKEIVKIHTIFGGKNPHPNWLVGGVPCAINVNDGRGGRDQHGAPEPWCAIIERAQGEFTSRSTSPTCLAIGGFTGLAVRRRALRQEHARLRRHPDNRQRHQRRQPACPGGAIINGDLSKIHEVDLKDPRAGAGVRDPAGTSTPTNQGPAPLGRRHRAELRARPQPRARAPTSRASTKRGKYSWIKAPRWRGHAMEVGRCRAW